MLYLWVHHFLKSPRTHSPRELISTLGFKIWNHFDKQLEHFLLSPLCLCFNAFQVGVFVFNADCVRAAKIPTPSIRLPLRCACALLYIIIAGLSLSNDHYQLSWRGNKKVVLPLFSACALQSRRFHSISITFFIWDVPNEQCTYI